MHSEIERMKKIVGMVETLKSELESSPMPFNIRREQTTAEQLIQFASDNKHVLELAMDIAEEIDRNA